MLSSSYGLCYSILATHSANCRRLFKVSSVLRVYTVQRPVASTTITPSIVCSSTFSAQGTRSSKTTPFNSLSNPLQFCGCHCICTGTQTEFQRMNPLKRPLEEADPSGCSHRSLHTSTAEGMTDACSASLVSNEEVVLQDSEKVSENDASAKVCENSRKETTRKKIRRELERIHIGKARESSRKLDQIINEKGLYEAMNAQETTFAGRETTVIGDAADGFEIHPMPVGPSDEADMSDGLFNPKKKKKMFAVMLSYSGKGYLGLQHNPPHRTIEGDLLEAMTKLDLITDVECLRLQVVNFQRAARTDKGVSAAKQVISVKLPISDGDEKKTIEDLNALLMPQIRVMDIRRATRSFNSKNWCDFRTYSYLAPSFAFAPIDKITSGEFRISEAGLAELRELMSKYVGTRNFHNFTIRKKPTEANAKRFIQLAEVGEPFVREGHQWILFKIQGQSFMMHQIRKMMGMVMSICRGIIPASVLDESFTHAKVETPKAPGLGLVLEQPHYHIYNKRFGLDGTHKPIDWVGLEDKVEEFRRNFIDANIINTELKEQSMLEFLKLLHMYSFTEGTPGSGIRRALCQVPDESRSSEDPEDNEVPADDDDEDGGGASACLKKNLPKSSSNGTSIESSSVSEQDLLVSRETIIPGAKEHRSHDNHEGIWKATEEQLDIPSSNNAEESSVLSAKDTRTSETESLTDVRADDQTTSDTSASVTANVDAASRQNS